MPSEIQAILGAPLSIEEWNANKDSDSLPEYLASVDEEMDNTRMTRQFMADDSHVLEQIPENVEIEIHLEDDDFTLFMEDSRFMEKLNGLHNSQSLTNKMTLNDVYRAYDDANSDSSPEFRRVMHGMNQNNILPSRTRRRVTFASQ